MSDVATSILVRVWVGLELVSIGEKRPFTKKSRNVNSLKNSVHGVKTLDIFFPSNRDNDPPVVSV